MRAQAAARASFMQFLKMPCMAEPELGIKIFSGDPKPFDMATGNLTGEAEQAQVSSYLSSFTKTTLGGCQVQSTAPPDARCRRSRRGSARADRARYRRRGRAILTT